MLKTSGADEGAGKVLGLPEPDVGRGGSVLGVSGVAEGAEAGTSAISSVKVSKPYKDTCGSFPTTTVISMAITPGWSIRKVASAVFLLSRLK